MFFVAKTRSNYSLIQSLIKIPLMLIKNPLLIAVILGALISIYKIQLFPILTTTLTYLANSAIPAALISLGAMLLIKIESKHVFKELIVISIFKLILHPLFVFIIFSFLLIIMVTIKLEVHRQLHSALFYQSLLFL